jgi:hypothetical protein
MKFSFKAKIYKVGINPCVKVPLRITKTMEPKKGYIPIKGIIEDREFQQTLVPVKDSNYRLFVNGPMLEGSGMSLGKTARFVIEQDFSTQPRRDSAITPQFKKLLRKAGVLKNFEALTPYRQKEVLRYLYYLKSDVAKMRNMKKVVDQMKSGKPPRIP